MDSSAQLTTSLAEALAPLRDEVSTKTEPEGASAPAEPSKCVHDIRIARGLCFGVDGEVTDTVNRRLSNMLRAAYRRSDGELCITVYPSGVLGKVAYRSIKEFGISANGQQPRILWMVSQVNVSHDRTTGMALRNEPPANFLVKPFHTGCMMVYHNGFVRNGKRILAWVDDPVAGKFHLSPGGLPVTAVNHGQSPVPGYMIVERSTIKAGGVAPAAGTIFPEQLDIQLPAADQES